MRLCVPVPCFFKDCSFPDAIRQIGKLGFDAAETYNWKSLDLEAVKAACCESGVELLSMCTTDFHLTDAARRNDWLSGLKESCEAAKFLGVKHLISQSGPDIGLPREVQHQSIVDTLSEAIPILENYGVTIMVEPLNVLVNHPGNYLVSSKEAFAIIREVHHPLVKIIFDIYHQQISEGNILPNITQNLDCIAHLHAAGHPGRNELQYGENDYRVIFSNLDRAGYQGACGLEYRPLMNPIESLKQAKVLYGNDF